MLHVETGNVVKPILGLQTIPLNCVYPSGLNPRKSFPHAVHAELVESIKTYGVLQPILVRPRRNPAGDWIGGYEVVAGERRFRAAQVAREREKIPSIVREMTDTQVRTLALIENIQREGVNVIEEARALLDLRAELGKQTLVAEAIGKDGAYVSSRLALLDLPDDVQDLIIVGKLRDRHGRALLRYKDFPAIMSALAAYAVKEGLSVRALEVQWTQWDSKMTRALQEAGSVRTVDSYTLGTEGWEICSKNCPFKAFRKGQYSSGLCFYPPHYQELLDQKKAHQEAREAEAIRVAQEFARSRSSWQAPPAASAGPSSNGLDEIDGEDRTEPAPPVELAVPVIPNIRDLKYGTYEAVDTEMPGCSESCSCRSMMIGYDKSACAICLDPAKYRSLRDAEEKRILAQRAARADSRFLPAAEVLIDDPQLAMALSVFTTLTHIPRSAVIAAAEALGIEGLDLEWITPGGYPMSGIDKKAAITGLLAVGEDELRNLGARAMLQQEREIASRSESYGTYYATWILKRAGLEPNAIPDAPVSVSEPPTPNVPKTTPCPECGDPVDHAVLNECGRRVTGGLKFSTGAVLLDPEGGESLLVCPACAEAAPVDLVKSSEMVNAGLLCKSCGTLPPVTDGLCAECGPCPDESSSLVDAWQCAPGQRVRLAYDGKSHFGAFECLDTTNPRVAWVLVDNDDAASPHDLLSLSLAGPALAIVDMGNGGSL